MKLFVIDGNNVYHAISAVRGAADQRRAFMDYLSGTNYFSAKKKATVVFDGSADESHTAGSVPFIKVIYSDQKKADDVIRKIVERESKKNRDRLVVISDDREVLLVAKESRVATMRNADFLKELRSVRDDNESLTLEQKERITEELRKVWG
ncbi:MAG: YacP-like NYN domain protein [bacterium ADurb.Bin270]|jgi:hypothetical protein|nr:NYN domain-containing protein [Myxococcales bacterium]OQA61563.1 MAG: YacP-like NYN domain protein [bacterium ADurb.Bin270]